jgi:16S rRNA (guanine527-N7)-methyltransferase
VAASDLDKLEHRHIHDSLRAAKLLRRVPPGPGVDVGSGAGLPGIPLALADPTRRWRLIEPRTKRAAFLEECVRRLELTAQVIVSSAQVAARDPALARGHVVATARALAPPTEAFLLLLPLLADGGLGIVWTGPRAVLPSGARLGPSGLATMRAGDTLPPDRG